MWKHILSWHISNNDDLVLNELCIHSYEVMKQTWLEDAGCRPDFTEIVRQVAAMERCPESTDTDDQDTSGYLDMTCSALVTIV